MEEQRFCQCCGMPMPADDLLGTLSDGSKNPDYCVYCLIQGDLRATTLEEQIEVNVGFVDEFNKAAGTSYTADEYRELLWKYIPTLKHWLSDEGKLEWVIGRSSRAVLTTMDAEGYPHSVEMDLLGSDDGHILYFSTPSSARKVVNIRNDPRSGVFIARCWDSVSFIGDAEVVEDMDRKSRFWDDRMLRHYPKGVGDPRFCLIRFNGRHVSAWIDRDRFEKDY